MNLSLKIINLDDLLTDLACSFSYSGLTFTKIFKKIYERHYLV